MPRRPNILNNNTENCSKHIHQDKMIVESDKVPAKEGSQVNGIQQTSELSEMGTQRSGGGGRRKKTRPTRVFLDSECEEAAVTAPAMDTDEGIGVDSPDMDRETLPGDDSKASDTEMMMDVEEAIACDLCNHSFASQSLLTQHIESVHKLHSQNEEDHAFPTRYHQLGNELQLELGPKDAAVNAVAAQQLSAVVPTDQPPQDNNVDGAAEGLPVLPGKAKIFHQDAFCELCDREFCNKYFLKTHKANKHGIYEADDSDSANGSGGQGNVGNTVPAVVPPVSVGAAPVGGVIFPGESGKAGVFDGAPSSSSFSAVNSAVPSMLPLQQTGQDNVVPKAIVIEPKVSEGGASATVTSSASPPTPSKSGTTSSSGGKTVPPDMEDYCEICQKHFCNKYYLKKHKHDVHGIVPEPTPNKRGGRSSQAAKASGTIASPALGSATSAGSFGFNSSITSSAAGGAVAPPLIIPQTPPTSLSTSTPMNGTGSPTGMSAAGAMANLMFINPFAPPVAIIQTQPTLQGNTPTAFTPQQLALPQVPPLQPLPTADSPKLGLLSATSSSSTSTSPSTMPLPKDALRSMGVLNADAYCELCRKEFCNRYFLRIHKANKHGIFTDDLLLPPPPLGGLGSMGPILQVPNIPGSTMEHPNLQIISPVPDLVKAEKPEGGDNKAGPPENKPKTEESTSLVAGKSETCEVCKKDFPNIIALRVHMLNAHNVKPKDVDLGLDASDSSKIDLFSNPTAQGTMFSNMIAAKLADRVSCDICHKEVCNKYFLRTHKMKVHGIDPTTLMAMEAEKREKGSPAQTPAVSTGNSAMDALAAVKTSTGESLTPPKDACLLRPRDDELLKMGIDPEAYCEICKKEFCSKYFLKTHKLNIHGIKGDKSSEGTPTTLSPVAPLDPLLALATTAPVAPPMASVVAAPPALIAPQGLVAPPGLLAPPLMTAPQVQATKAGKRDSRTWKWKEPVNSTRVMCSICNKEVCNKYFLKTHMLKRHGLNYDLTTGVASAPSTIPGVPDHLAVSPAVPSTASAATLSTTAAVPAALQGLDLSKADGCKAKSEPEPQAAIPQVTENGEDGQNASSKASGTIMAKTWSVPAQNNRKTEQEQGSAASEASSTPSQEPATATAAVTTSAGTMSSTGDLYIQKCELCGMVFGEKVTLQLHMIRDHQAEVTVHTASVQNGVDARSSVMANIGLSLRKKYQRSLKPRSRTARLRRLGVGPAGIGENVKSAIVNHIQRNQRHQESKRFRCAHCQQKFNSRVLCQSHIKTEHSKHQPSSAGTATSTGQSQLEQVPAPKQQHPQPAVDTTTQTEDMTVETKLGKKGKHTSSSGTRTSGYSTRSSKLINHSSASEAPATSPSLQKAPPSRNGKTQIPVGYATPSDTSPATGTSIVMQAFTLQEKDVEDEETSHFATSVVHLPVFERISQPTAVTFMLTPMEQ